MTAHPGKRAVLLAACDPTITDTRRLTLIRCAFGHDADEQAVLDGLTQARQLQVDQRHYEVTQVLDQLIADHIPKEA